MFLKRFLVMILCAVALVPQTLWAATATLTSESDFEAAIDQTGADTTTVPGELQIASLDTPADPAEETRHVAVLVADDATLDDDLAFYLDAYFVNTFTYGGDNAADDVIEFSSVTSLSDLSGYDIVIVDSTADTDAETIPQTVLDAFASAGGTVVEDLLGYSVQRQTSTYGLRKNFTYTTAAIRDMAFDGTNIWTLDDTSPERVLKIDPATGSTLATYCSPNLIPRGIEYVSGTLYISDSQTNKLYAIAPAALTPYDGVCASRATGTTYSFSDMSPLSDSPWGLTYGDGFFYSVDSVTDKLYKFSTSGANLVLANVWDLTLTPRAVDTPRGLAYANGSVYYADMGSNLIYQLSPTDASVIDAFDPYDGWGQSDVDITGIAFINGDMWLTDDEPGSKKLFDNTSYYRDTDNFEYFSRGNTSFETPSFDPQGLVYDGANFWSVDDYNNRLYKLDATTGAVVSSCQTPWSRPSGLAYGGGSLYLSDWNSDRIYVLNPATCAVTNSYATPGGTPHGLAYDGTHLWHVDSGTDLIYELNPADGTVLTSFAAPGGSARGLAWDGTYLWMSDITAAQYYQIDTGTHATVKTRTTVELDSEGITFKDGVLWSTDATQDRIYNVDSELLATGALPTPAGNTGGFAYDGSVIWSTDATTDRIYKVNKTTGAVITSYASPGLDPRDITYDGANLWVTTDGDNKIYKMNPADGSTITSFNAPATTPTGIVYAAGVLYTSDPISNKVYQVDPADGSVDATFDTTGSASGVMAYDGSSVWMFDSEERLLYRLEFDDDDEGIVAETTDVHSTSIGGIEFIGGVLWTADTYFDQFFDSTTINAEPDATIEVANAYTSPYAVDDTFYYADRNATESYYIQRRLLSVPETGSREILATSSRGGAIDVHETLGSGNLFALDFGMLGQNYEVARQTVPAVVLFFDALGIQTSEGGVQENTLPTYASLLADLGTITAACPDAFVRSQIGTSSNSQPLYAYTYGTVGKPSVLFNTGTHGNEEQPVIAEIRWMHDLCDDYLAGTDRAMNMFHNYEVIFVPLLNPYGLANKTRYNAHGVDVNRNYDFNWSAYPSHLKGTAPFSEPESQAIRDLVLSKLSTLVFVQDSHSAMEISPGMTWGCDFGSTPPDFLEDIHSIFTSRNEFRWFDTRAGVGRWLTYDRYTSQGCEFPYFGNWIASLGIPVSTTEVLGKKDVGTQRLVHTTAWEKSQFNAIFDALSYDKARSVFHVDSGNADTVFQAAVVATDSVPAGSSISYRYGSNSTDTEPTTWYDAYSDVPANQFLFVEADMSRTAFSDASPSIQDLTLSFGVPASPPDPVPTTHHSQISYTPSTHHEFNDLTATLGDDRQLRITWTTEGTVDFANLAYTQNGVRHSIAQGVWNDNGYIWPVPSSLSGDITLSVEATDGLSVSDTDSAVVHIPDASDASEAPEPVPITIPGINVGDYIRGTTFSAVYVVDGQYHRRPFGDAPTFFTWQPDFSQVKVVSDFTLAQLAMGAPMAPKPGVVLVKIQSSPKVYVLEANPLDDSRPTLRWIPSEAAATQTFGPTWSDYVLDVPVTLFTHFALGADFNPTQDSVDLQKLMTREQLSGSLP